MSQALTPPLGAPTAAAAIRAFGVQCGEYGEYAVEQFEAQQREQKAPPPVPQRFEDTKNTADGVLLEIVGSAGSKHISLIDSVGLETSPLSLLLHYYPHRNALPPRLSMDAEPQPPTAPDLQGAMGATFNSSNIYLFNLHRFSYPILDANNVRSTAKPLQSAAAPAQSAAERDLHHGSLSHSQAVIRERLNPHAGGPYLTVVCGEPAREEVRRLAQEMTDPSIRIISGDVVLEMGVTEGLLGKLELLITKSASTNHIKSIFLFVSHPSLLRIGTGPGNVGLQQSLLLDAALSYLSTLSKQQDPTSLTSTWHNAQLQLDISSMLSAVRSANPAIPEHADQIYVETARLLSPKWPSLANVDLRQFYSAVYKFTHGKH
ncbi:hypothetical protein JCM6882_007370 [Rhodosporidiobolus microsporus]